MKVLLLGRNGQVGYELRQLLEQQYDLIALGRNELELQDLTKVRQTIKDIRPQLVINAAAYTAVDKAEAEPEQANLINAKLPGVLAEELAKINGAIIHYSTDYVFNGSNTVPYTEEDSTAPLGVYGRTKLAGEVNVAQTGVPHIIMRTSWVYGARGHNFALTMLKLAREREILRVVNDQVGAPTWSKSIAEATVNIIRQGGADLVGYAQQHKGVYNFASQGETTWFHFAQTVLELDPHKQEQVIREIRPITTKEYPTPAQRPAYSVLDTSKIRHTFKLNIASWQNYVQECFGG